MEIQPRRHILELWRATVDYCYRDDRWYWGGLSGRNSISDAEQLLILLYPATVIGSLGFASVDETADDVLEYLSRLGGALEIPRQMVSFIGEYLRTYLVDGTPDFSGGSYFYPEDSQAEIKPGQRELDVVDSYSMSVRLCLATLIFLQAYRKGLRSVRMLQEIEELELLSRQRLSAAIVGLLRSFTIHTFPASDPSGETMCAMLNQRGLATEVLVRDLLDELAEIRVGLRQELKIGSGVAEELENPVRLFECGWSWGIVDGAPEVTQVSDIGQQPTGVAEARPSLYFTVAALDGIQDLFTERTQILGLLTVDQQRLARALQLRWDLTQQFWAKLATFGGGRWPLEDLPWQATDGTESDYYSLLLTSIVIDGPDSERLPSTDVGRVGQLVADLADRGRITRRPTRDDPALAMHLPGLRLRLVGSEKVAEGPQLAWTVASYTSLVLKRLLRVAKLLSDSSDRLRFLDLADQVWAHVERRRIETPYGRGLWDEPTQVFHHTSFVPYGAPSWYQTERVMEALVAAASVTMSRPAAAPELVVAATQVLAEAEHQFDQERLRGTNDTGEQMRESFQVVGAKLRRAREILRDRPSTAIVLASDVLRELDAIDAARQDTARLI
jgi:hypothetical protein